MSSQNSKQSGSVPDSVPLGSTRFHLVVKKRRLRNPSKVARFLIRFHLVPLGCSHGHNMSYHNGQHTTCAKHLQTSCLRDGTKLSTQGWANSAFDRTCWRARPHGADISLQTTSLGNSYAFTRNHMLRTCAFERGWGRDKKCPCGVPKVRAIFNMRLFA